MLQYVNEFTCTADDDKKTVVIHFKQNEPLTEISENGETSIHMVKNDIASIIIDADGAHALSTLINQILEQSHM